jgi:hypothetical protein
MTPVTQTKVVVRNSNNEIVQNGNCLASAIASMLDLPLSEVPNFEVWYKWHDGFYDELVDRFLIKKGLKMAYAPEFKVFHPEIIEQEIKDGNFDFNVEEVKSSLKDKYYFICGKSKRGVYHITIWQNGVMVHDPHPTREGIDTLEEFKEIIPLSKEELDLANDRNNYKSVKFPCLRNNNP